MNQSFIQIFSYKKISLCTNAGKQNRGVSDTLSENTVIIFCCTSIAIHFAVNCLFFFSQIPELLGSTM